MRTEQGADGRVRLFTDSPFESLAGYCRAIRVGNRICVSGTTAMRGGEPFAPGDAARQTACILEIVRETLSELGASMTDVVWYRVFLVDLTAVGGVASELGRVFGQVRPASTLVGIAGLADSRLVVEIEFEAELEKAPSRQE